MFTELTLEDRAKIRESYKRASKEYAGRLSQLDMYRIYPFDWHKYMSPLECIFWDWAKSEGIKLLPQYPFGKYFVDFVDPNLRIAFEIDGKMWHQDKDADEARQKEIESYGLTFIRLRARAVFNLDDEENGSTYRETIREALQGKVGGTVWLF